jgi:squalene-hopene/tetraprenyl-beta-curcumene cyclase
LADLPDVRVAAAGCVGRQVSSIPSTAGMTYSKLKSIVYAGLNPDDVRVKAAMNSIARNYTQAENPGSGQRGL